VQFDSTVSSNRRCSRESCSWIDAPHNRQRSHDSVEAIVEVLREAAAPLIPQLSINADLALQTRTLLDPRFGSVKMADIEVLIVGRSACNPNTCD
jgi:hypothetical protein